MILVQPKIEVKFEGMPRDRSVEAAAHRWCARLETVSVPIYRVAVVIEKSRQRTIVCLILDLVDGAVTTAAASHDEVYVAVADAFRMARRRLLHGGAMLDWRGPAAQIAG